MLMFMENATTSFRMKLPISKRFFFIGPGQMLTVQKEVQVRYIDFYIVIFTETSVNLEM